MDTKYQTQSSEETAEESFEAAHFNIIMYDGKQDLEKWLEENAPSKISTSNGIRYIQIGNADRFDGSEKDVQNLRVEFEDLKASKNPINFYSITELAVKNSVLSGSWIFSSSASIVDMLWGKIARQFVDGCLKDVATSIRVTPMNPNDKSGVHRFYVKQKDFTVEEEVDKLNKALRTAGIRTKMTFKPEMFSCLGIKRNNEFNVQPVIYTSVYDALKRESPLTFHM